MRKDQIDTLPHTIPCIIISTISFVLLSFICAGAILHPLGLKDALIDKEIIVVRKVDYNEYIEENYIQIIEFILIIIMAYYQALVNNEEWYRLKALFFTSWLYCFTMELILQITGNRTMDLLLYSRNKPKFIVTILNHLMKKYNNKIAKLFAISFQAYAEGAIYNTKSYMYGTWLRIGINATEDKANILSSMICFKACFMAMHYYTSKYLYNWPQPIVYGSMNVLGKRGLLKSLSFRTLHCYAIYHLLKSKKISKIWYYMAITQVIFGMYFFTLLEYLGRSYVEKENGEPLSFAWNVAMNLIRCFEVLSDGAVHFFILDNCAKWLCSREKNE